MTVIDLPQTMTGALPLTRRLLMRMAAAGCVPAFGQTPHVTGVQLYTVRDVVLKRPLETLQAIAEIGYCELEMLRDQVVPLSPYLKKVGLQPVSMHFETPLLTGNWKAWKDADMPPIEPRVTFEDAVAVARDHGFEYIVFNYLAPEERLGLDFYRALADKLNTAAQKCRSAGLRFCYHNHDFEFEPKPTHKPIEILLERLDKNLIGLEVDTFWVSMAGVDAAAFMKQNTGRVELVHLKDRAPGTPVHYDIATVPNNTFRELGSGDLPIREILSAASQAGAKHYFVEQDFSSDPIRSLKQSYTYLRKIGF
jgi:sugar phosphate isomerase/epimerase